jgi:NAD(P)-dependent dehydrogenase (short-subunit alcohol dehydrogenase family)
MSTDLGTPVPLHRNVYPFISPTRLAGSLAGKIALITGAGRGIGKAISLAFAEAGADVALLARTQSQLEEVAATIRTTYGRRALVIAADVTDGKAVADAVERTERELGPVDVVVPNAGVNSFRPIAYTPIEEWWKVMEVNVKGQMLVAQEVLKGMRMRGNGVVIFNASRAAVVDVGASLSLLSAGWQQTLKSGDASLAGASSYCASKLVRLV